MSNQPDLSNFSELSEGSQKQRIDEFNNYLWGNNWTEIENKEEIIQEVIDYSRQINYLEGLAFATLILGVFFCNHESVEAIQHLNIALSLYRKIGDSTGIIRCINNLGNTYLTVALYDKVLDCYREAAALAEETGNLRYQATMNINTGIVYSDLNNDSQAKVFLLKALEISKNLDLGNGISILYDILGNVYRKLGEFNNAEKYLFKAIENCRKFNQTSLEPTCLTNIGTFYQKQGQLDKAMDYYNQALDISEQISSPTIVHVLKNIGQTFYMKKEYKSARQYLERALNITNKLKLNFRYIHIYELLFSVEKANHNFETALEYQEKYTRKLQEQYNKNTEDKISMLLSDFKYKQTEQEKEIFRLQNVELKKKSEDLEHSYINISTINSIGQKITSTIKLEEVLDAIYIGVNSMMKADVFGIALIDKSTEEIDYKFFIEESQRIFPPRISLHLKNNLAASCVRKKKTIKIDDAEIELKGFNKINKSNSALVTQSIVYIPLVVENEIIGVLTVQSYQKNQYKNYQINMLKALSIYITDAVKNSLNHEKLGKLNTLLTIEKKELAIAKEEAEIANQEKSKYLTEILDSIRYAERIQRSMLPDSEIINSLIPNSFYLRMPKDIVGGDGYYLEPIKNSFYIALFDCTGHGVPGAMMSMVATVFLRRIIIDYKSSNPSAILKQLNIIIRRFLKQNKKETISDDGLDVAVCFVKPEESKLLYAGARLPLYYHDKGEIIQIKGDRQSIGYKNSNENFDFTEHEIKIQDNSTFYLSTDGFIDQIGGEKNLPFGWKRFMKLLKENHKESIEKQCKFLKSSIIEYKGRENPQIDDITVIGFKI